MTWWLIWVILVIAALALLVWVGLRLWRSFKALLTEMEKAQEVLDALSTRVAELEALQDEITIAPELLLTPERRSALAAARADVKARRRSRRLARSARATAQWDAVTGGPQHPTPSAAQAGSAGDGAP